ncbi:MAG: right-handed parallel beta-helix repeat-containing protein [Acidimicrobiia bacterium]|nr:right-handed parallel beta-helix repeat-containing protein [Acidimicrobiia bacterium]
MTSTFQRIPFHLGNVLASAFLTLLLASSHAEAQATASGRTLYVATNGNDKWTGRLAAPNSAGTDGPLLTLPAARDRIRAARRVNRTTAPSLVLIRDGTYRMAEPFVLTPEDSGQESDPLIFAAYPDERPVLSGGRSIAGWRKGAGETWSVHIPEVEHGKWVFHQLFVNGRRSQRARTPNRGFFRIDGPKSEAAPFQIKYRGDEIKPSWAESGDVEVVALFSWAEVRMPIRLVDAERRVATLAGAAQPYNKEADARYYIENAPDALDAPGEWYLDRKKGVLSYWPLREEDMNQADVAAPVLTRLVHFQGDSSAGKLVHHVVLHRIAFQDADWNVGPAGYAAVQAAVEIGGALKLEGTADCAIELCSISRVEGYALDLGKGCKRNRVEGNEIADIGAGGIKLGWGREGLQPPHTKEGYVVTDREADLNEGNLISDNHLRNLGNVFPSAVGVWAGQTIGSTISHNHIHDLNYSAISAGWNWGYGPNQSHHNRFEYNHLHHIGREMLSDMGAIYTLGIQPGTVIRNNLIHDVTRFNYGGWGIYFDEGSSQIVAENNVVYRTASAGLHQHYGRENVVRNNIFAFGKEYQLTLSRPEDHLSFTFEKNIVYWDEGALWGGRNWVGRPPVPECVESSAGKERHPEANCRPVRLDNNFYFDARGGDTVSPGMSLRDWQARNYDVHSVFGDPLFANPTRYHFELKPDSPALKRGFQPIDLSRVGPRADRLRELRAKRSAVIGPAAASQ